MYISVPDAAEKFNISKRRVQILCEQGRIDGAELISGVWRIPDDAVKPSDARKNRSKNIEGQMSLFEYNGEIKNSQITLDDVCKILCISKATAKNWIRLNKLKVNSESTFDKEYIDNLSKEIRNGSDGVLKSRRNKKSVAGKSVYKDYISDANNIESVESIMEACESVTEKELRIIIAYFSLQLFMEKHEIPFNTASTLREMISCSNSRVFNSLLSDLTTGIDERDFKVLTEKKVFNYSLSFVPSEDTIGFLYISLKDMDIRKKNGTYYTSERLVTALIDNLFEISGNNGLTACDPCCGTGNFLMGLLNRGIEPNNIYGQDIDDISVCIARINAYLVNENWSCEELKSHIVCKNTLESDCSEKFDIILGNPPWGYSYSEEEIAVLKKRYITAETKGTESFELFIEQGLNMLKDNGYMVYILPESLLSVASHYKARMILSKNCSFKFVNYLGNSFSNVQCPAVIIGVEKDELGNTKNCKVTKDRQSYIISENRPLDSSPYSILLNNQEYDCLKAIEMLEGAKYLYNNAKFALGIVTGNNKGYIKNHLENGYEIILKGSDIYRYRINKPNNYILFAPDTFQQIAPTEIYRAKEKLLYRFICEFPVFAYDNNQTLSLNSCNILIPQIDEMGIKYIMAILNSGVSAFYISKKYNSVKLLRSHIESLPIPAISRERQLEIEKTVDCLMNSKENVSSLYKDLDEQIMELYGLNNAQRAIIRETFKDKNMYI